MRTSSRPLAPRLLGLVLLGAAAGCTFIIEPPDPAPPATVVAPFTCLPVRVDPATGEGALEIEEPVPTVQVAFVVRLERSTVSLAPTYARFMEETVTGLAALGAHVTVAALFPLDERPMPPVLAAWGCGLEDPADLPVETVLLHYATNPPPPDQPLGCALDPILDAGEHLTELATQYPPELSGQSGRSVFGRAPDLFLVVYLDALARRRGAEDPACARASRMSEVDGRGQARWLDFAGPDLPPDRVGHWFAFTDEGVDDAVLAERCRGITGFDLGLFDALEASPLALYGPVSQPLVARGSAAVVPMCELLVARSRYEYMKDGLGAVAARLGLTLDPQLFETLFAGEATEPANDDDSGGS